VGKCLATPAPPHCRPVPPENVHINAQIDRVDIAPPHQHFPAAEGTRVASIDGNLPAVSKIHREFRRGPAEKAPTFVNMLPKWNIEPHTECKRFLRDRFPAILQGRNRSGPLFALQDFLDRAQYWERP
jgi:hypothetical protein